MWNERRGHNQNSGVTGNVGRRPLTNASEEDVFRGSELRGEPARASTSFPSLTLETILSCHRNRIEPT